MTIYEQKDATPATGDLSAPLRGAEIGARRSSFLPGLLFFILGGAGGYYTLSMMSDVLLPQPLPVAAAPVQDSAPEVAAEELSAAPAEEPALVSDSTIPPTDVTATVDAAETTADAENETAAVPVTDPALATPPADLPVPANANVQPEAAASSMTAMGAPAIAPATSGAVTPVTNAAAPAAAPAEVALMQNAAVLDQLSQPAGMPAAQQVSMGEPAAMPGMTDADAQIAAMEQEALLRPLPKKYLVVRKNHDAEDVDSRLTAARTALAQNSNSGALQLFNELYKDFPRDRRVLMGRAVSLQKLGQNGQALAAYEEVLSAEPQNLEALTNMLGLLKIQDPALAVQKLGELQQAYPYNADIAAQLAIAHGSQGSYEEALRYLDTADALKPGNANIMYNRAVLYDKMGRKTQAVELYRQLLQIATQGGSHAQQIPVEAIQRRLSTIR